MPLIRLVGKRKRMGDRKGVTIQVGVVRSVHNAFELLDAMLNANSELKVKNKRLKYGFGLRVYVVGVQRDWLLAAFRADDTDDTIDARAGQVYGQCEHLWRTKRP